MDAAQGDVTQTNVLPIGRARASEPRTLLALLLVVTFAVPATSVLAQDGGLPMPKFSIGGEQKRKLTPEEEEQQKKVDSDYKAATRKIPDQKAADPWADVRQAPSAPGQKAATQNAATQKKKLQQAQ